MFAIATSFANRLLHLLQHSVSEFAATPFKSSRKRLIPLPLKALVVAAPIAAVLSISSPAYAASYSNAAIADLALGHVGETYGDCWTFVRDMIYQASGNMQDISAAAGGGDYFAHLSNAGGTQISSIGSLAKGDVVQEGGYGGHTYIIVGAVSGSTFDVVDANHDWADTVMHYRRTVTLDSNDRAYRFGSVGSSSSWNGVGNAKFFGSDRLYSGQTMSAGQYILSGNVQHVLMLQTDGNLVLYHNKSAVWNSHTAGSGATQLMMQMDGNLVLYTAAGTAVWNSHTAGTGHAYAAMQSDGNFVIYADSIGATWQSNTSGHANYTYEGSDRLSNSASVNIVNDYLRSADKRYALLLQPDGNLVLFGPGYHVLWNSQTAGSNAAFLIMQYDGNLVLYTAGGNVIWNSHTAGRGTSYGVMQNDGNFVVYNSSGQWTWQTNTDNTI